MMKMENNSLLAYSSQSRQNRPITIWNNRHTANSNLPCTPSVTPKDTRPRFCNPSSLSSHSLIYSFTPTYTAWRSRIRKSAREQICTPTHTSVCKKMIILLWWHTEAGATLSVAFTPIPPERHPSPASSFL